MGQEQLSRMLAEQGEAILARWMDGLARRSWLLGRAKAAADGGPAPLEVVRDRGQAFLELLAQSVRGATALEVGSAAFRAPIQNLAFTAGWLAGRGLPVGDALALVHSLDEALGLPLRAFFESLTLVVAEAYCAAAGQREQARYRDAMEKVQLVCTPHPRLPCVFLTGDPDLQALDDALGRMLMLAVMREAPACIVDGSGLFEPAPVLRSVAGRLAEEKRVSARRIVCGISAELIEELRGSPGGAQLSLHEGFAEALAEAAALLGVKWPTGFAV